MIFSENRTPLFRIMRSEYSADSNRFRKGKEQSVTSCMRFPGAAQHHKPAHGRLARPMVVRRRPGTVAIAEFETIPDQRCTVSRCTASGKRKTELVAMSPERKREDLSFVAPAVAAELGAWLDHL